MALTVNWATGLITCPQSDLTLVTGTRYQITVTKLWELLRDKADDEEALPFPVLFTNIPPTASTPRIVEINADYYTFQFENGAYSVDIINGNTNLRDVEVKNTVSVGTNNTTGFIDPEFLEAGLFLGGVAIAPIAGYAGTAKTPLGGIIGTRQTPSNNLTDSLTILSNRGLNRLFVTENLTVTNEDVSTGIEFVGDSPFIVLTAQNAADLTNCAISNLTVVGQLDGLNMIRNSNIGSVTDVSGFIEKCGLNGDMSINGATVIMESYAIIAGSFPTINTGANNLIVRDFHGSMGLTNVTGGSHSIGIYGGKLTLDNTCTGGSVYVRGAPYAVEDNSNGTTVYYENEGVKITEMWKLQGLDSNNPMTVTKTARTAGTISQVISGDGVITSTVTRA